MAWTKEQEEAINIENTNVIVSAGAGSGKTAVLTERVLRKVKNNVPIRSLLILTFTKMAAKEMKDRIRSKLTKEGLLEVLDDLDSADITTFDAYSLALVKKYYYLLNISENIKIIDSSVIELYKKDTLNSIFDELYDKGDEDFLSLIKDYCLKDDREIFDYILNLNNKLDLKPDKKKYLNSYVDIYFNEDKINNDIDTYINYIFSLVNKIREDTEYIDDSDYLEKLNISLEELYSCNNYDDIKSIIDTIRLPRCVNTSDITKKYKEKISGTLKEIKDLSSFVSVEEIKSGILLLKNNVSEIIKIMLLLDDKISEYKKRYDAYEYHDIAFLAIKLVRDNEEIREEIKNNLNEILIDEYQDTNDIQEEFISYIENNNVYVVGDIKQSIYRFRNANPYIFKNKYDNYSKNINGHKIDLNKNFRSREEVINNINLIFERIMDDTLGGASYRQSHEMIFGNNTYNNEGYNNQNNDIEVYAYDNTSSFSKEEVESFIIAKDINDKINSNYQIFDRDLSSNRKIQYSDFAILVDNSRSFELYKKILEYKGIPVSILKDSNLTDGILIILIKNILSFIIKIKEKNFDIEFKKLFMSIGRSFLFEIDDDTLFNFFTNNNFYDSSIYKVAYDISLLLEDISLNEIIDIIIEKYDIYSKLFLIGDYEENILRLDKLNDIINNLNDLNYTIYDLENYLSRVIDDKISIKFKVGNSSSSSVKIMTIHASKGLEFGVVYYASLYNKFNIKEAISKFSFDANYGIVIPYKDNFLYNTIYHNLSYKNYLKENISERIRLFYVALTRAREKMILLLPYKDNEDNAIGDIVDLSIREKYKSFSDFFYSIKIIINKYIKNIDIDNLSLTKDYNILKTDNIHGYIENSDVKLNVKELDIFSLKKENSSFSKKSYNLITKKEGEMLEKGRKLHRLFELIDFKNIPDNLNDEEKLIINNFIDKIDLNYLNVYKEYEFVYDKDNLSYHGIIDLLLEYEDSISIIDYKLKNINDIEYLKQLNGYKDYIQKLFKKDVNIYLYSIFSDVLEEQ